MNDQETYTRQQVKDILHSIRYDDILTEDEIIELTREIIKIYKQCRERKLPDCLIMSGLYFAINKGAEKYYELGGT